MSNHSKTIAGYNILRVGELTCIGVDMGTRRICICVIYTFHLSFLIIPFTNKWKIFSWKRKKKKKKNGEISTLLYCDKFIHFLLFGSVAFVSNFFLFSISFRRFSNFSFNLRCCLYSTSVPTNHAICVLAFYVCIFVRYMFFFFSFEYRFLLLTKNRNAMLWMSYNNL